MDDILLKELLKSTKTEPTNFDKEPEDINSILDKLEPPEPPKERETMELSEEDMEKFIRNNTGQLIKEGLDYVRDLKEVRGTNIDSKEIESIAEMIKATAAAIESLNKIATTKMKIKSMKDIKQLEVDNQDHDKITITRDQLFKMALEANQQNQKNVKETKQTSENDIIDIEPES